VVDQPPEPSQLVVEFRPGLRVTVRQIDRPNDEPVDRRFQIPAMSVVRIVRQPAPSFQWLSPLRKDRDTVEPLLPMPYRPVTRALDRELGKRSVRSLQLLQADDIRTEFFEPLEKSWQSTRDAVDIEGGDFHDY
jgi:hypothetical protein